MKVAICIPTYKREKYLQDLLASISKQLVDFELIVIVGDNEGYSVITKNLINQLQINFPFQIFLIPVCKPGISAVRNELIQAAFNTHNCDLMAMIDDDEVADQYWVQNLVNALITNKANVVGGRVVPKYDIKQPNWVEKVELYNRPLTDSKYVERIYGAGNFIIDKICLTNNVNFDDSFSFIGGEDNDFFYRLKELNCIFYQEINAITFEHYPSERVSKIWAINRAIRIGKIDTIIKLKYSTKIACIAFLLKAILAFVLYSIYSIVFVFSEKNFMRFLLKCCRQYGKITGFISNPKQAYGVN